jgi:PKD repeat protein
VTATDRDGEEGTDTVEITVAGNEPPTVTATADPATGMAPLQVRFRATGTDPDGRANRIDYAWDFGDGGESLERNPRHTYMEPGTYTATVTATDEDGGEATGEVEVVVGDPPGNAAPSVDASADPGSGPAPLNVRFTSQGTDPDGDRLTYEWDFDDGSAKPATRNARHTYTAAGTYDATVTVTDPSGASDTATVTVTVTGNRAPTVRAAADPKSGSAPLRVRFTSAARDADGDRLSSVWDFGNGVKAGGRTATYTYTQPGTYDATVTVTDPDGATGTATVQVTVTGAAGAQGQSTAPPAAAVQEELAAGAVAGESASFGVSLARSMKVRRVVRRGLRYKVRCGEACRVSAVLRLSGRRLGASKALRARAGASRTVVVRLDRRVRRQLVKAMRKAGVRRVKATVVTRVLTADSTRTIRRKVVLKR